VIEHGIVRSEQDKNTLISVIKQRKLPFKVVTQDVYPVRSLDQNAYYWFIITIIAYCIGEDYLSVHKDYANKFLYGYWPNKKSKWSMRVRSTTELNTVEMADYTNRVRIDAVQMGINTPNPNEIITDEET